MRLLCKGNTEPTVTWWDVWCIFLWVALICGFFWMAYYIPGIMVAMWGWM